MILIESIPWVLLVVVTLTLVGVILYVTYRGRMRQAQRGFMQHINALMAPNPHEERSTLLMRGVEPEANKADGFVVWLPGYEPLDAQRMIPARDFERYVALPDDAYHWMQVWHDQAMGRVASQINAAFAEKLAQLQAEGWQIKLDLPFSEVDRLIYLAKPTDA